MEDIKIGLKETPCEVEIKKECFLKYNYIQ